METQGLQDMKKAEALTNTSYGPRTSAERNTSLCIAGQTSANPFAKFRPSLFTQ